MKPFSGSPKATIIFSMLIRFVFLKNIRERNTSKVPKLANIPATHWEKSTRRSGSIPECKKVKSCRKNGLSFSLASSVELIERLVLALTQEDDWVLDPFLGTGTTVVAAVRRGRRGVGAEVLAKYATIARERIRRSLDGTLPVRPMERPVFDPKNAGRSILSAPWLKENGADSERVLLDGPAKYRSRK